MESSRFTYRHISQILGLVAALVVIDILSYHHLFNRPGEATVASAAFRRRCSKCGLLYMPIYLSALSIIKNEALYLPEWIEYHLLVGVERFDLIMNNNQDNTSDVLWPYISLGIVRLNRWDGRRKQMRIYNAYLPTFRNESCWVAVIDADEFVVPLDGHSVPEIIRRFENFPGVVVYWVTFGTNGKNRWEHGLVIERFSRHTTFNLTRNRFAKTIVNPRRTIHCGIHDCVYVDGALPVDLKGIEVKGRCLDRPPVHDTLRINHYKMKSVEEFQIKLLRGRADIWTLQSRPIRRVFRENMIEFQDVVANDSAVEWAIPLVKASMAKRRLYGP